MIKNSSICTKNFKKVKISENDDDDNNENVYNDLINVKSNESVFYLSEIILFFIFKLFKQNFCYLII
jgi:hypothetical protein